MPDPSRPGVRSPVMASGGSWSALAPCGLLRGSVMSTGDPQRMQVGSQLASTNLTQFRYAADDLPCLGVVIVWTAYP